MALNINIQPYNKLYDPSNINVYVCNAKCLNGMKLLLHIENIPVNTLIWVNNSFNISSLINNSVMSLPVNCPPGRHNA